MTLFSFGFFLAFANTVSAQTPIYRSVGPSQTQALASGTSNAMTISGTTATFASALPEILGNQVAVGDVIQYDSDGNGTIDSVAFIHAKISATEFTVANAAGGTPTAVTGDNDWSIFRAYTSLANAENGAENTGIDAGVRNFDTWTGGRDLVANNERWVIMAYANGTTADTTRVFIQDWVTSETNDLEIIGDNDTGLWSENHYRIIASAFDGEGVITINNPYTTIRRLQVEAGSDTTGGIRTPDNWQPSRHVDQSIIRSSFGQGHGIFGRGIIATRNLISGFNHNIVVMRDGTGNENLIYSNTVINAVSTGISVYLPDGSHTLRIKNNIVVGSGGSDYSIDFEGNGANVIQEYVTNLSSDNTSPNTSLRNLTVAFVDANNGDYRLASTDTAALDAGTDLSTDLYFAFNTDIKGVTRPQGSEWDIGAFEYDASGPTAIYRSVGPSATSALATGASNALTISGTTATFGSALPDNVGVGDAIQYDSDGNSTIDAIAFIHARTNSTTFTVANAAGGTPTAVTGDNDWSIFRAYTSLANAEAGIENTGIDTSVRNFDDWTAGGDASTDDVGRDLVTNNEQWNITLYANGTTADTVFVSIIGWTTSVTQYINIYTPISTNEVGISQRHDGEWDDSKYKMVTNSWQGVIGTTVPHIRFTGLQVESTASDNTANGINGFDSGMDDLYFSENIIRSSISTGRGISVRNSFVAKNNIIEGFNMGIYLYLEESGAEAIVYNNTIVDANTFGILLGNQEGLSPLAVFRVKNNIVQNSGDSDYYFSISGPAPTTDYATNISSDNSSPNASFRNLTVAFVDANNGDYRLSSSDTSALDTGTNLSADPNLAFNTDIKGVTRPQGSEWDIGAHEGAVVILPTISGVIYIDEGQTTIGADRTVRVKVNGAGEYSGLTNSSGQYSINDVTISSAGDIVTVFLDGATEKAVTVTRAADNASNITGLNLYQNFVIVRHEDAGPITNTNLDQYDSGGDADIQFTVTGGNITVSSGNTLLVAGGKTYAPGGNITTPSLEVVGTLNSGANTLELSDSLGVSGSLTGSGNVTVSGGSATGDGAINLSGGTFLIDGDGNFGGNGNWAFNNLTFGDGSGFATTTASGSGSVTVEGIMTIATNQTLEAGSKTWNLHGSPAGGGGPSSLLLYVNFEEGPPAQSPYVLGATEHSAGSSNVELEFTFGGAINATGATVGNYGVQFGGFGSSIEIPVSNGDIFNKNSGRVGLWVKFGGGDDIPIFVADGSHLQLETRNNGVIRLRWNGNVILNSGDWGESMPTDRTPQFLEVRWDRANNIRAYRISTNSTEGTWRTNTDSWSEPPDATAVQLWGPYGIVYSDNWLISEDPDEDLWELRNMASYAEYGGGGEPANSLVVASGGSLISQSSTISFAPTGVNLEIPLMNYHNLELDVSGNTFNIPTGILNVGNNLSLVRGTLDLNTNDPNVSIGGNLTIASGSIFEASNSGTLSVSGNLINNGTFNHNGGTVTLTGSGASVVDSGSSMIFNNLTSTVAGKLLRFGAGRSFSVLGNLTITGSEGSPINIESSVPGRQWILALSAEQSSITHAVVKDSGCAPGSPVITLGTGMVNDGNNGTCWFRLSGAALEFFGGGGSSAGATSGGGSPAGGGGVTGGTPVDDGASGGGTPAEGGDSGGGGSASP